MGVQWAAMGVRDAAGGWVCVSFMRAAAPGGAFVLPGGPSRAATVWANVLCVPPTDGDVSSHARPRPVMTPAARWALPKTMPRESSWLTEFTYPGRRRERGSLKAW